VARRFIVIEGLIGVGKTSLARVLESEWDARLVLEPAATNPFLESFYRDPEKYGLPVQVFYLLERWRQQEVIAQQDLFNELVVSDYLFVKDRLFAEKTLGEEDLSTYGRLSDALGVHVPRPDLVIFLDAPIETIMNRINKRSMPGEDLIERAYLEDLHERYMKLLASWTACPVLHLDNSDLDYVDNPLAKRDVLTQIESVLDKRQLVPDTPGSSSDREVQPSLFGSGDSPGS